MYLCIDLDSPMKKDPSGNTVKTWCLTSVDFFNLNNSGMIHPLNESDYWWQIHQLLIDCERDLWSVQCFMIPSYSSFDLSDITDEHWSNSILSCLYCCMFSDIFRDAQLPLVLHLPNFCWNKDFTHHRDGCRNFLSLSDAPRYFWCNRFLSPKSLLIYCFLQTSSGIFLLWAQEPQLQQSKSQFWTEPMFHQTLLPQ